MRKELRKAVEAAEQELQDKEVSRLKGIIKDLLVRKQDKERKKGEIDKEIRVIRQAIDDFKAGRLDKIKELIEKDPVAKEVLPLRIVIIDNRVYHNYPTQPWKWTYQVVPNLYVPSQSNESLIGANSITYLSTSGALGSLTTQVPQISAAFSLSGMTAGHFTGGTYDLGNGQIMNL